MKPVNLLPCSDQETFLKRTMVKDDNGIKVLVKVSNTHLKPESEPNIQLAVDEARKALLLVNKSLSVQCIKTYFESFHNVIQYFSYIEVPTGCCGDLRKVTYKLGKEVSIVKSGGLRTYVKFCGHSQYFGEVAKGIYNVVVMKYPSYRLNLSVKSSLPALSCDSIKQYFRSFKEISEKTDVKITLKLQSVPHYTIEFDGMVKNCLDAIALVSSKLKSVYKHEVIKFTVRNSLADFLRIDCNSDLGDYKKYMKVDMPLSNSFLDAFRENIEAFDNTIPFITKSFEEFRNRNYKDSIRNLLIRCQMFSNTNADFVLDTYIKGSTVEHLHNNQQKKILEIVTGCLVKIPVKKERGKYSSRYDYKAVLTGNIRSVQSAFVYIISYDASFRLND